MNMDHLSKLSKRHKKALKWFIENHNAIVPWSSLKQGATLFASKAKGIYKPHWTTYALSVRQSLHNRYDDREPSPEKRTRSWTYYYCPEQQHGKDFKSLSTNKALMACCEDQVPVGVLVQVSGKPNVTYRILGVAIVSSWNDKHFVLKASPEKHREILSAID